MKANTIDRRNKAPMKLSEYCSSGREPHVFRADGPDGLLGVHADIIASSLNPEEKIHYLLYTPIREAGNAPFGIHAEPASHALAITDKRFLISKNMHIDKIPPIVQDIPFSQVICIEVGNALLLGWLAIRYREKGQLSCASLFYTARGSHHFEAVVREFRKTHGKSQNYLSAGGITWTEVWEQAPKPQTAILKSLILEEEKPAYLFRSTETWVTEKRRRKKVCITAEGRLLVTDCGLIHAVDERPIAPHILSYGVNVCCIPPDAIHSAVYVEKKEHAISQHILRMQIGYSPVMINYDIPFDGDKSAGVNDFVCAVREVNRQGE